MLETLVRFRAFDDTKKEFRREINISGKSMDDINKQSSRVVEYLTEQTRLDWYWEFVETRDTGI